MMVSKGKETEAIRSLIHGYLPIPRRTPHDGLHFAGQEFNKQELPTLLFNLGLDRTCSAYNLLRTLRMRYLLGQNRLGSSRTPCL